MGYQKKQGNNKRFPAQIYRNGLISAAIVVVGALVAYWVASRDSGRKSTDEQNEGSWIADANPQTNRLTRNLVQVPEPANQVGAPPAIPADKVVETLNCITNSDGMIVEKFKTADGKTHKVIRPSRPPIFRHITDDLLSMVLVDNGPMPPLPLSGNMDKEFLESLKDPISVEDGDDEKTIARKEAVIALRKEVDELMRQGVGFTDILREHQRIFNDNRALRDEAIAELRRVRDEGDTEGTRQYLEKVNAFLEKRGIEPISMPTTMAERRQERLMQQKEEE